MQRRKFLSLVLALPLAGCGGVSLVGGDSNGNGTTPTRTTGTVTLPTGYPLPLNQLNLVSGLNTATLNTNGTFTLDQFDSNPSLLILTDTNQRPLLLGFSGGEVSPLQTSVALLFYALGAFTLPSNTHERVRTLLAQDSRVQLLATQLDTLLTANPYAFADSDPTLINAVVAVREALFPPPSRAIQAPFLHRAETLDATLIQTTPENEQHGYLAAANGNGLGLTIMNTRRRNAIVSIYETAYTDANNVRHTLDESTFVRHQILNGELLWGTSGLAGVVGSLVDVAAGTAAYGPVTSGPYNLDLFPSGATKSEYRIHIVANGNGGDSQGVLNEDPTLDVTHKKICFISFIKDVLLPTIATLSGLQSALSLNLLTGQGYPSSELLKNFDDLAVLFSGVIDTGIAINQSNARNTLVAVLKALGNNGTLRQKFIEWVSLVFTKLGFNAGTAGQLLGKLATSANAIVIIVDKMMGVADLGAVLIDWGRSDSYIRFDAKVIAAKVKLSPNTATLNAGDPLELKVSTIVDADIITYHWSILDGTGTFRNPISGLTGAPLDSSAATVQYQSDVAAKDKDVVQLQVEAFIGSINDPKRRSIGTATSTITIKKEPNSLPVTRITESVTNKYGTQTIAVFWEFPTLAGAKSYSITFRTKAGTLNMSFQLQQSDVDDTPVTTIPFNVGEPLPPRIPVRKSGGPLGPDWFFRRGNTIRYLLVFGDGFDPNTYWDNNPMSVIVEK